MYSIIDTSTKTTTITEKLKNAGIQTVIRYYDSFGHGEKLLDKEEAIALSQSGLDIMVVFEDSNNETNLFNYDRGLADATAALDWAKNQINQPSNSAIYFAVDYDATPSELESNIIYYFQGIQKAFEAQNDYTVGAYGSGLVINKLKELGLCSYRWLSMSTGFYGSRQALLDGEYELNQIAPSANLCGIEVDYDERNSDVFDIGSFILTSS